MSNPPISTKRLNIFVARMRTLNTGNGVVGLLFHTFGGQYCIDHSVRIYANLALITTLKNVKVANSGEFIKAIAEKL